MNTNPLQAGEPFIFMKVGVHAQEDLASIIKRKREEIEKAGVSFWGYGGNTCHPLTAVQPFMEAATKSTATVRLLMQEINSHHYADPVRAESYSSDGITWKEIPKAIHVLGSRYALVLSTLEEIDLDVSLDDTRVAIGRLVGKVGAEYIRGRVDKACLTFQPAGTGGDKGDQVHLALAAKLAAPYAVLLK